MPKFGLDCDLDDSNPRLELKHLLVPPFDYRTSMSSWQWWDFTPEYGVSLEWFWCFRGGFFESIGFFFFFFQLYWWFFSIVWNDLAYIFFSKVAFENLDLEFKLIDFKCLDFKSINFRSYFKSKYFKSLKLLIDLLNLNSWPFFKFPKQFIWILITQIQIQMPKSCHSNTSLE